MGKIGRPKGTTADPVEKESAASERLKRIQETVDKYKDRIETLIWENIDPTVIAKQITALSGVKISEAVVREHSKKIKK